MIKKGGVGGGGAEGRGEANVRLVPVISQCKTWLSMVITFSIQKATKRARAGFVAAHTCSSGTDKTASLCAPACHCRMLNFSPRL